MKMLWLSHGSTLEGAERSLFDAVKSFTAVVEEVHVVIPSQGKLLPMIEGLATSVSIVNSPWWVSEFKDSSNPVKRFYSYFKAVIKLIKLFKQIQPDIIITNTVVTPCGAIAAKLLGIPHIWYIREFLEEDHGWTFEFGTAFSSFWIDRFSTKVIANSQAVCLKFSRYISPNKFRVVYNAVEVENISKPELPIEKKAGIFYVVLVGRKTPGKGQRDAIEAVSLLNKKGLRVHLWLIGAEYDNYAIELKKLAEDLHVKHEVEFIPFVSAPQAYVLAADAALVCSKCEAFGRVTVEAMKLGKPVIGSNSGSTPDLIQDGWNGMLYEVSSPASLAEKIEILIKDASLRKKLETNAFQWANSRFTLENYSSDLLEIFYEVVKNSRYKTEQFNSLER